MIQRACISSIKKLVNIDSQMLSSMNALFSNVNFIFVNSHEVIID